MFSETENSLCFVTYTIGATQIPLDFLFRHINVPRFVLYYGETGSSCCDK